MGHFVEAVSGIDVALWDIVCQALDLPACRALHVHGRRRLPAYGSSFFAGEPERMVDSAKDFVDRGYGALTIKLGLGLEPLDVAWLEEPVPP